MVHLSPPFDPPILKGIKVYPDNPFRFDFILDKGDSPSFFKEGVRGSLKQEATKLIKYFLASLTIPEKDLWVNLSPYEKDRIIPQSFGLTEMGRDLLAEDYMLKQITASLIYPENEIGKKFCKRIYEEAQKKFGTTNIPVNTFNKVWIMPEKAVVYENAKAGTAYVIESKLKVMLEQDYLSLEKHAGISVPPLFYKEGVRGSSKDISTLGSQVVREIVIPELTKEVNENKNFAQLRQVYNSLILSTWYKKVKDSILGQVYEDKKKIAGVGYEKSSDVELIYQRYLQAFKKGVYNYIQEEQDPLTQETVPRKYFSGGVDGRDIASNKVFALVTGRTHFAMIPPNRAMSLAILIRPISAALTFARRATPAIVLAKLLMSTASAQPSLSGDFFNTDSLSTNSSISNSLNTDASNTNSLISPSEHEAIITNQLNSLSSQNGYGRPKLADMEKLAEQLPKYNPRRYEELTPDQAVENLIARIRSIKEDTITEKELTEPLARVVAAYANKHQSKVRFIVIPDDQLTPESGYSPQHHNIDWLQLMTIDGLDTNSTIFVETHLDSPDAGVQHYNGRILDPKHYPWVLESTPKSSNPRSGFLDFRNTRVLEVGPLKLLINRTPVNFDYYMRRSTPEIIDGITQGNARINTAVIFGGHGGDTKGSYLQPKAGGKSIGTSLKISSEQRTITKAMANNNKAMPGPGGIDLTPLNINQQSQNNAIDIKFHINPTMLAQFQNSPGFDAEIIDIQPLKSMCAFLSINNQQQPHLLQKR